MKLLIDIGNSRLKWAAAERGVLGATRFIDYRQSGFLERLTGHWRDLGKPAQLAMASVAAPGLRDSIAELAHSLWPDIDVLLPRASSEAFGVKNAYRVPEQLGVDRWLALVGAHRSYSQASCIVDCGTAMTVDFVETDGRHLGGVIAPGLALMQKTLSLNTAALPLGQSEFSTDLALETDAAIASGTMLAGVGLIEAVLKRQSKPFQLILTGGDAQTIAGHLSVPSLIDSDLIFKGLLRYCRTEDAR